jgi:predicted AlkP superfamily phosphohydrolase/phosphomutase
MTERVSIIGLDGATFRLILPWVQEGRLPTLAGMMKKGTWGDLQSTIHPLSPQAWASFMTGKNPGKHGIFEFIEHKPYSYEVHYVNGGFVQGKKLWEILSDAGKRVCIINVPFTYPPNEVNGYLIAGLDAPGPHSDFCYPPSLLDEITKKFGDYQLRQHPYKATPENFLKKITTQFDYILKVAKYLKAKEAWDFFMVVFESTDLVQHFYWHYAFPKDFGIPPTDNRNLREAMFDIYKQIDDGLRELLALCAEEETVIVMSDHGFSPCRKIFFMDNWLHKQGYLTYRHKDQKHYNLTKAFHLSFQKYFPNRLKGWVTSLAPGLKDKVRSYLTSSNIDWSHTKAFSLGIDSTNIFINLEERFPEGNVREGKAYENLRDEITGNLEELTDPETGERIIEKVYKREDLYHGDCLKKAPDLLVTWKKFEYNTRRGYGKEGSGSSFLGSSLDFSEVSHYSSLQKSGTHHPKGIFIARGPMIKNIPAFEEARIIDLAPTILYLMDEKIPQDMDGRILERTVRDEFLSIRPVQFDSPDSEKGKKAPDYSKHEEEYIRDKLQGLGYID